MSFTHLEVVRHYQEALAGTRLYRLLPKEGQRAVASVLTALQPNTASSEAGEWAENVVKVLAPRRVGQFPDQLAGPAQPTERMLGTLGMLRGYIRHAVKEARKDGGELRVGLPLAEDHAGWARLLSACTTLWGQNAVHEPMTRMEAVEISDGLPVKTKARRFTEFVTPVRTAAVRELDF